MQHASLWVAAGCSALVGAFLTFVINHVEQQGHRHARQMAMAWLLVAAALLVIGLVTSTAKREPTPPRSSMLTGGGMIGEVGQP